MFTIYEVSDDFRARDQQSREILANILKLIPGEHRQVISDAKRPFLAGNDKSRVFHVIREGFARCAHSSKTLFFLCSGDMVGWLNSGPPQAQMMVEADICAVQYECEDLQNLITADAEARALWNSFLSLQFAQYAEIMAASAKHEAIEGVTWRYIQKGAPIIIEDASPSEVYIMHHGSALVYLKGHQVGRVLEGELFGAMAASLKSRRTASVIAAEPCIMSVLPKEKFLDLIKTHPQTVLKLVESMARIIVQQNERTVEMSL